MHAAIAAVLVILVGLWAFAYATRPLEGQNSDITKVGNGSGAEGTNGIREYPRELQD